MKIFTTVTAAIFMLLLGPFSCFAQNDTTIYATMDVNDANYFKSLEPDNITILDTSDKEAAVKLMGGITDRIRQRVQTHGSGYIFRSSEETAVAALDRPQSRPSSLDFTITEDAFVNECLDMVDPQNIEMDILDLQGYGTRHHTYPQAVDAVYDQKDKWDAMIVASGRTDVHTRIYDHVSTPMPSVILTMEGANTPDEFVIIGGHIDSTSYINDDAPGADDNASGISSLNEMVRVLLAKGFVPNRTIEVMAFAAEEIGLVGSDEIASSYSTNGVDVVGYVQFDMTGYNGSANDIYILNDWYTSDSLNDYLALLMDHYNSSGPHAFSYGYSQCGYACSDHASWAERGYDAAMPFEAKMGQDNPNIHTPNDTYSFFDTPDHAAKFTKLGLEFLIEAAKPQVLNVDDHSEDLMRVFVRDKVLTYQMGAGLPTLEKIVIYNVAEQKVISNNSDLAEGRMDLNRLDTGFYFAQFHFENGRKVSQKLLLL